MEFEWLPRYIWYIVWDYIDYKEHFAKCLKQIMFMNYINYLDVTAELETFDEYFAITIYSQQSSDKLHQVLKDCNINSRHEWTNNGYSTTVTDQRIIDYPKMKQLNKHDLKRKQLHSYKNLDD